MRESIQTPRSTESKIFGPLGYVKDTPSSWTIGGPSFGGGGNAKLTCSEKFVRETWLHASGFGMEWNGESLGSVDEKKEKARKDMDMDMADDKETSAP